MARGLCTQGSWREERETSSLPGAHGPAVPGSHWHIPGHSAGLGAAHRGPLLGGKLLPMPRSNIVTLGSQRASGPPNPCSFSPTMLCPKAASLPGYYLASPKHICNSTATQVGCGNDILLATGVASSNSFGCCHGDTLGHSDEIFWGRGLGRWLWGTEDLLEQKKKKNFTVRL